MAESYVIENTSGYKSGQGFTYFQHKINICAQHLILILILLFGINRNLKFFYVAINIIRFKEKKRKGSCFGSGCFYADPDSALVFHPSEIELILQCLIL